MNPYLLGSLFGAGFVLLIFVIIGLASANAALRNQIAPTFSENTKLKAQLEHIVAEREIIKGRPVLVGMTDEQVQQIGQYIARMMVSMSKKTAEGETVH